MAMKEPKVKIFVAHHKPWYVYEDDVYVPIQVWKKNAKVDLWILWDDTWDNISEKNSNYAELTAQYWVWKNYDLSDVDYVWFCHYRRYLWYNINKKYWISFFEKKNWLYNNTAFLLLFLCWWQYRCKYSVDIMKEVSYNTQKFIGCNPYDVFLAQRHFNPFYRPLHQLWLENEELRKELKIIIVDLYPDYEETIKIIDKQRKANLCNIFIMDKILFNEYCNWLFSILFVYEDTLNRKWLIDLWIKEKITVGSRFLWCLAERLFNLRIEHKRWEWTKISNKASIIFFKI